MERKIISGNPDTPTKTEPKVKPEWIVAPDPGYDPTEPIPFNPDQPVRDPKQAPVEQPLPWGPRNLL